MGWLRNFLRFFGYGLLGVQLAHGVLVSAGNLRPHEEYMVAGFANLFIAVLWVPIGGLLSALAASMNAGIRANSLAVAVISLIAGASFFAGVVAVALLEASQVLFVLPAMLFVSILCLVRLFRSPSAIDT